MDPKTLADLGSIFSSPQGTGSNIANILAGTGWFGNAGEPYKKAGRELEKYLPYAQAYQNPFWMAGANALPAYQGWVNQMQNPQDFINNLMGGYQESPWAHYQQEQAIRRGQNEGSASGLTGSTPMAQFMQQNARDISSQDMNQWLQNVLGINTTYGAGLGGLISGGQGAGNVLTDLLSNYMTNKANLRYGQEQAGLGQTGSLLQGISGLLAKGLFGFQQK